MDEPTPSLKHSVRLEKVKALLGSARFRRAIAILAVVFLFVISFPLAGVKPTDALRSAATLLKAAFWNKGELVATIPLTPREQNLTSPGTESSKTSFPLAKPSSKSSCSFAAAGIPDRGSVILSEIAWMGSEASSQNEWIELANISDSPALIGGWSIVDEGEQISLAFPAGTTIPPKEFLLLERKEEAVPAIRADAIFSGGLRNTDEGLRLFDDDCNLVDEVLAHSKWPAGDNATKRTMERNLADLSWHTSVATGGTPRAKNSSPPAPQTTVAAPLPAAQTASEVAAPAPTSTAPEQQSEPAIPIQQQSCEQRVLVSEVMAGSESSSLYEFVELYNPTACILDLTGWAIKKRASTGSESTLVAMSRLDGKFIPAQSYFLLANEGGYAGAVQPDVWWPKSYTLAYTNNAVLVYNANGEKVDETRWSEIPKGQSWTRISPDSIQFSIQNPSPRNSQ